MKDAVPSLAKEIALEVEIVENQKERLWGVHPVVEALIEIGNPAIPAMLANIETGEDAKVRMLSTDVIRYIQGAEVGRFIIESSLRRATDETARKQLKEALAYLEKPKG